MKTFVIPILLAFLTLGVSAQETKKIFGKVTDGKNPMENVNVSVEDKDAATATNSNGRYEIQVEVGDKLQFSHTGMRTVTIRVEDVTRVLNPVMIPEINELEGVEVTASKRRSQKDLEEDYSTNKNIIRTAWGYLDTERAAGYTSILAENEVSIVYLDMPTLLGGRFASITPDASGWVSIRGRGNLAAYDIDGQIFAPLYLPELGGVTQAPQLNIGSIKRVAILYNLAATAIYGTLGKNGVVVINTFGGNPTKNEIVDRARLRNNYADGLELSREEVAQNAPTYMKEFMQSGSFEESKALFEKHHKVYSNSPYFLLDAYTHFSDDLDQMDYADTLIEEYFGAYTNNPVLMKALAYTYESQERFEKANDAYKEVFILRPNYVQSYMDMANSYRNLKEAKQAASMYARYEYLIEEGFLEQDTVGFGPIMSREFNNLLLLEKNSVVKAGKAQKLFVADEDFKGTRLVFEWNDGEAEFDLQFVNPENQYYKWKHNIFENADAIALEKDYGYNVKEYLVDGSLPGTWQVNVNYSGNKSLTPTYLKATIYSNYGSKSQSKEVKVFKLSLKDVNQELFRLTTGNSVVAR